MVLKGAYKLLGDVLTVYSLAYIPPLAVALYFSEKVIPFLIPLLLTLFLGLLLRNFFKASELRTRDAFFLVSVSWLAIASLGSLPYMLEGVGDLSNPVNAFFESMSGFTTTGASVIVNYRIYPESVMFWRQFTQWIGGMGIIVLTLAILPRLNVGGAKLFKLEAPGPELEKLDPHIRRNAEIFWLIYIGLTLLETMTLIVLHIAGLAPLMTSYNALIHSFTTLSTGGFSPYPTSIGSFTTPVQIVVTVFMFLAGTNFALYWYLIRKDFRILRNDEFRAYALITVISALIIAYSLMKNGSSPMNSLINAFFHTISILTTTGYAVTDFTKWPLVSKYILLALMFIGGCSGSTAGGIKVVRWLMALKAVGREIYLSLNPKALKVIRLGNEFVDEKTLRSALSFVVTYFIIFFVATFLISYEGVAHASLDLISSMSAVAAALGNIGPGLGVVGPAGTYAVFPSVSKLVLAILMWLGRLEIFTVIVLFTRYYWKE